MFTGIVEEMARVVQLEKHQNNITLTLTTALAPSFNVDQSVSHNGCCLTVVHVNPSTSEYQVTAIHETIVKTKVNYRGELEEILYQTDCNCVAKENKQVYTAK